MSNVQIDEFGNEYQEISQDTTIPEGAYFWIFNGDNTPITRSPSLIGYTSIERINRIVERYKQSGYVNANAKFFVTFKSSCLEECSSPGCKRRMKEPGQKCYWCGA